MKKKIAIIGVASFALFGGALLVQAANSTPAEREALKAERVELREEMKEERAELKEERIENREQIRERKCENVQARIRTRVKRYENKQAQHQNVFGNLVTRVEGLVTKLTAKKLDTSKLKADLEVLKTKVKELESEHQSFIEGLNATETVACGESDGEYKKQLGEARKMSMEVRTKLEEVRSYYKDTIRQDILALREQLEAEVE